MPTRHRKRQRSEQFVKKLRDGEVLLYAGKELVAVLQSQNVRMSAAAAVADMQTVLIEQTRKK